MTDPLREACRDRCADFGDPPCYEICADLDRDWTPCPECVIAIDGEPLQPRDDAAAVGDLFSESAGISWPAPDPTSPYFCHGPTLISFSGGRTSAYMLFMVLWANGSTKLRSMLFSAGTTD